MDILTTASLLAGEHAAEDPEMRAVYWHPATDEVRLVEVSGSVPDRGEFFPFRYAPDPPDVQYPSVVILLGVHDWERVQRGELTLPSAFAASELELLVDLKRG